MTRGFAIITVCYKKKKSSRVRKTRLESARAGAEHDSLAETRRNRPAMETAESGAQLGSVLTSQRVLGIPAGMKLCLGVQRDLVLTTTLQGRAGRPMETQEQDIHEGLELSQRPPSAAPSRLHKNLSGILKELWRLRVEWKRNHTRGPAKGEKDSGSQGEPLDLRAAPPGGSSVWKERYC